jgi:hypothetical protein
MFEPLNFSGSILSLFSFSTNFAAYIFEHILTSLTSPKAPLPKIFPKSCISLSIFLNS